MSNSSALPFVANFAAGAIAGISEILTFYPLGESHILRAHARTLTRITRRCREFLASHAGQAPAHAHRVLSVTGQDAYAAGDGEEQAGCARELPDHHQGGRVRPPPLTPLPPQFVTPCAHPRPWQVRPTLPRSSSPAPDGGTEACDQVVRPSWHARGRLACD